MSKNSLKIDLFSWIDILLAPIARNWWQCTYISINPSPHTKLPKYSWLKNRNIFTAECVGTTSNTSTILTSSFCTTRTKDCTTARTEAACVCWCIASSLANSCTSSNLYRVSCRWKKKHILCSSSRKFFGIPIFSCWLFWLFCENFFIAKMSLKTQAGVSEWYFFGCCLEQQNTLTHKSIVKLTSSHT